MAIAALAAAGRILERPEYQSQAARGQAFLETHLVDPHGQLIHSCRGDHMGYDGLLEDYAYDGWALLELFRSTGEERYLHRRRNWPGRWKSGSEIPPAASISMGRRVNSWWSGPRRPMTGGALRQLHGGPGAAAAEPVHR